MTPETPDTPKPLTEHEKRVATLILENLEGNIQGFPDSPRKLRNVARAWAAFISLDPYHVQFPKQIEQYMTEEEKKAHAWKEGIIPGEWLVQQVRDSCEWMPAPILARELYCRHFPPRDHVKLEDLPTLTRSRVHPADMENPNRE